MAHINQDGQFAGITDLIEAEHNRRTLEDQITVLAKPERTDLQAIPHLYEMFIEAARPSKRERTQQFALIVLYLYAPAALMGARVPGSVKQALAELFGRSVRTVENILSNVISVSANACFPHRGRCRNPMYSSIKITL